jgi:rubrerythrin
VPFETWCEENGERGAKLLAEYADTEMGPREVTKGTKYRALWSCRDCGHEWRTTVGHRTKSERPSDCPACSGYGTSLQTWCEENGERGARLLEEYADTEKSAREVTKGSDDKALWNCRDCGHEWLARVGNRTRSGGKRKPTDCPACSGYGTSLETWCEENGERGAKLLAEYADTEKGAREVTKASEHKALWSCRDCGHEWRATVKGRTKSDRPNGCPDCNRGGRPRKPIQL